MFAFIVYVLPDFGRFDGTNLTMSMDTVGANNQLVDQRLLVDTFYISCASYLLIGQYMTL